MPRTLVVVNLIMFIVLPFLNFSCSPIYVPNARNAALLQEKGEIQISASAGMGYNLQTAYAAGNHFGIMANGLLADNKSSKRFRHRTQYLAEAGIGYFNKHGNLSFEIYSGFGTGKGKTIDSVYNFITADYIYSAEASYTKIFLQPAIGMNKWKNFEWSFSPRLTYITYSELNIREGEDLTSYSDKSFYYLEPSANIKISVYEKKVFLTLQSGVNLPLYNESTNDFNIELFHSAIGLQWRILKNH